MSNIYLKVYIEKNRRSQNLDFLSLKNLSSGQSVFEALQLTQIPLNFKDSCFNLKLRGLTAKAEFGFAIFLFLEGIMMF